MEIGCLRRILKRAKLWSLIADDVNIPKPPPTIGRALSPEQKKALLQAAASNPGWQTALCAAVIAFNSTMRGCELKGLRWANVDLLNETLTIPKSKTEAGLRRIPITPEALEAFVVLRARAELFGTVELSHFVFASYRPQARFQVPGHFDKREIVERQILGFGPTRAMVSWRTAWRSLTKKAGLRGLRFHDLRHHAISELLEDPNVSVQTVKSIAGHVSQRMIDRYAHIGMTAKRTALAGISKGSHVTNDDTNRVVDEEDSLQVVEDVGRRVGI